MRFSSSLQFCAQIREPTWLMGRFSWPFLATAETIVKKKPLLLPIFFLLFFISPTPSQAASSWTYMVYMGGDNNISDSAVKDIEEMRQASFSYDINIIVQVELSPVYTFFLPYFIPNYDTYRLFIRNGNITTYNAGGNLDMADPSTLGNFISWGTANWPADKYCLTIWSHGSGWKNGIGVFKGTVQDNSSGSYMQLTELSQGIAAAGLKLDLLNFDACLMGMYEVAYEFRHLTDYIVFSEESEPADGDPYDLILTNLAQQPSMDAEDLAALMVKDFIHFYRNNNRSATKSAVRTNAFDELHGYVTELAEAMNTTIDINGPALALARDSAQQFSTPSYVDLISFLDNIRSLPEIGEKALTLKQFLIKQVVVANDHYSATYAATGLKNNNIVEQANGLSIYLPAADTIDAGELQQYRMLSCNLDADDGWAEFIADLLTWSTPKQGKIFQTKVPGRFAYGTAWINTAGQWGDADIDMYVIEADGTISTAWMGQSTANGYFSADSLVSHNAYEMYTSKPEITPGDYFLIIHYAADGSRDSTARVGVFYLDFLHDISVWSALVPDLHPMGLWNPAPEEWDDNVIYGIIMGYYSDWWIPGNWLSRSETGPGNTIQLQALYKLVGKKTAKTSPFQQIKQLQQLLLR